MSSKRVIIMGLLVLNAFFLAWELHSIYKTLTKYKGGLTVKTFKGDLVAPIIGTFPFKLARYVTVEYGGERKSFKNLEKELSPIMNNASNNPDNSNPAKVVIEFEENRWGEVYNSHIKSFEHGYVRQPK